MRSIVPRIRTVSCADAGKTIETEMKLAAASMHRDMRDMFVSLNSNLTAGCSIVGGTRRHFGALPLQPRGLAYIPGPSQGARAWHPGSWEPCVPINEDRRPSLARIDLWAENSPGTYGR